METKIYIKEKLRNKLFETINQTGESNIWYHGSSKPIKKFLYSMVGKGSDRISSYHGWGIYFIKEIERARKYGDVITKMSLSPNANILKDKITPEQLLLVYNGLVKENVKLRDNDNEWFNNPTYGEYSILNDVEEFYDYFMRGYRDSFKTIKDVSDFLLRSGIDGLETTNDVNDNILVIFNENVIEII